MNIFKDIQVWFNAMGTLPWTIRVWACLHPLPQILGGLFFIQTLPGFVIFSGRIISGVISSQVHKRSPFSKLMGPLGHVHWVLIVSYLIYELSTQALPTSLFWFVSYVICTTLISSIIDVRELIVFLKRGHVEYKR